MEKRIIILIFISLFVSSAFSQSCMPTNGDYSNWNWENQSQCNWRMATGGVWSDINAPFIPSTSRLGLMEHIYEKSDYQYSKGWRLVEASFGPDVLYPFFVLYNKYRATFRVLFYLGDNYPSSHAVATCSYSTLSTKPGVLSLGNKTQITPDKYLADPYAGNDMIVVVIPNAATRHWAAADFPVLFDPYLTQETYRNSKFEFKLYAVQNYNIQAIINGASSTDKEQLRQHTIIGKKGDIEQTTLNKLNAGTSKLLKKLDSFAETQQKLTNAINKIGPGEPSFLQNLKSEYTTANAGFSILFKTVYNITNVFSATLNLFEFFAGKNPGSTEATSPTVTYQVYNLTGTMDIQQLLAGFSLKIPGALKSPSDTKNYYYDCPIGNFNIKISPQITKTASYERIACPGQSVVYQSPQPVVSGYTGMYTKYKVGQNFTIAINQISGMQLQDIKFAILCKPMFMDASHPLHYSITNPIIARHGFNWGYTGIYFERNLDNPIYQALQNGRLVVHKYDPDNGEIWYGSPYVDENCLKELSIEVPEYTEIRLGVIAVFSITGSDEPVIYSGKYLFDIANTEAPVFARRCGLESHQEQGNFPYSSYYNLPFEINLSNNPNSSQYSNYQITLAPGFVGTPNFVGTAIEKYKCLGNATFDTYNYNCSANLKSSIALMGEDEQELALDSDVEIYPNPSNGIYHIRMLNRKDKLVSLYLYNSFGNRIKELEINSDEETELDLSGLSQGIYLVNIQIGEKIITKRLILN